jgi:dienelactone hydrolase
MTVTVTLRRLLLAIVAVAALAAPAAAGLESWHHGAATGRALVCRPDGPGPFPLVLFNHGLVVDKMGYAGAARRGYSLKAMCEGLADEGWLGFFPVRESGRGNIPGHLAEVENALDAAKARPDVDPRRVAIVGFSRGGLLALMLAVERADFQALALIAPAPGRDQFARAAARARAIAAPVLVMVEASDSGPILDDVRVIEAALRAAGNPAEVIRYDRGGGHRLFWGVDYYWPDLVAFLRRHLAR